MVNFQPWHVSLIRTLYCAVLLVSALFIMPSHGTHLLLWITSPEPAPLRGELVVELACSFIALSSLGSLIGEVLYWQPQQQEVDPLLVSFGPARSRSSATAEVAHASTVKLALFRGIVFGVTVLLGSLIATVLVSVVPLPILVGYLVVFTVGEAFFSYMVATGELGTAMRGTRPKTLRAMIMSRFVRIPITVFGAMMFAGVGWWEFGLIVLTTELLLSPLYGLTYERLWQRIHG